MKVFGFLRKSHRRRSPGLQKTSKLLQKWSKSFSVGSQELQKWLKRHSKMCPRASRSPPQAVQKRPEALESLSKSSEESNFTKFCHLGAPGASPEPLEVLQEPSWRLREYSCSQNHGSTNLGKPPQACRRAQFCQTFKITDKILRVRLGFRRTKLVEINIEAHFRKAASLRRTKTSRN